MARKFAAFVILRLLNFEQILNYGCSDVWHYPPVMLIRQLIADADLVTVHEFYALTPDYWQLAEGQEPGLQKAKDFFTDTPPNCDQKVSLRLRLFLDSRLSGLAELSFGFPIANAADIGFMMLGPWARNRRNGRKFLKYIEECARQTKGEKLFLAVLEINPRARAFWGREGFLDTGLSRNVTIGDVHTKIHRLTKTL